MHNIHQSVDDKETRDIIANNFLQNFPAKSTILDRSLFALSRFICTDNR